MNKHIKQAYYALAFAIVAAVTVFVVLPFVSMMWMVNFFVGEDKE